MPTSKKTRNLSDSQSRILTVLTCSILNLVNLIAPSSAAGSKGTATFPTPLQFGGSQIDGAERVSSHSIGPVRTDERDALTHLVRLIDAAVEALGADHVKQGVAAYSSLIKFIGRNLARVAAYGFPPIRFDGRALKQNCFGGVPHRLRPTVCCWDFAHVLL